MAKVKVISKRVLVALAIIAIFLLIGTAGELDHDEYIEVNHTPITRIP